jgi:hypothetical protein
VIRYLKRGRLVGAVPTRAVSTADGPVLWLPGGTPIRWPGVAGRHIRELSLEERFTLRPSAFEPVERSWAGDGILILGRPGRPHSIWLFWEDERFAGWYVQLEARWQPSWIGFDTEDNTLDIWVEHDGSWHWKDEDELEAAVLLGYYSAEQASTFRADGQKVLDEWPFPTGWEGWRPDPAWPTLALPGDWQT